MKTQIVALSILLQLVFTAFGFSQDVRYYQLTTISKDGVRSKPTESSGLFITFVKEICYISDNEGFYSNNAGGKMKYNLENDKVIQYKGTCYFGNSEYNFNKDKSLLNIRASDGNVYVYKQATPKASVKTSTFGNIPNANTASASSNVIPGVNPTIIPTTPAPNTNANNKPVTITCSVCNGTGKCGDGQIAYWQYYCHGSGVCAYCKGKGYYLDTSYGNNKYMECTFCHKSGKCSSCNGTGKCPYCGGTGKK